MGFTEEVQDFFRNLNEFVDSRSVDYAVTSSSWVILIFSSYLLFTTFLGPKLMKHRSPFDIQGIVTAYNIFQIVLNGYLVISSVFTAFVSLRYSIICQPVGTGTSPDELHIVHLVWLYHLTKILDLLDTIFIILRKKYSQLSVLHIYHHAGMIMASWCALKYVPGGQSVLVGTINCFVHMIMYTYYLLTTMNPKYRSSWWKKHITQLQFGQFAAIAWHLTAVLLHPECNFPKIISYLTLNGLFLLVLFFINYYRNEYFKKSK